MTPADAETAQCRPAGRVRAPARRQRGFTLMELMVTVAVLAIVFAVGVPGFQNVLQNNRVAANTNDLVTALNLARSEASRRGARVTVCSSENGNACDANPAWGSGWIVMVTDRPDDPPLRAWSGMRGDPAFSNQPPVRITYNPRGGLDEPTAGMNFTLSPQGCRGENARRISITPAGRPASRRVACP